MKTQTHLLLLAVMMLAATVSALRAQLVADGATNTLSNVTTNFTGPVTVGTNGSFTLLVLSDNALVTNSARIVIGANTTAKSNEVQLVSPTARLQIGGSIGFRFLLVGSNGASSRLVVSNGAQVVANGGSYVGFGAPTSNNVAVVTGDGSVWSEAGQMSVGQSGFGNQLVVTNGGLVLSGDGRVGSAGSNNLVLVTGTGSHWSNQTDFFVGVGGAGNRLLIENGGRVSDGYPRIGANSSARSNEVVVTGAGSLWSNRLDLEIGQNGAFNRLVVSNGGWVVSSNATMGVNAIATNNEVVVTGAGSVWSNRFELHVGESSAGNRLEVNSSGWVVSSTTHVGNQSASNFALVTGAGSLWSNRGDLYVGNNGSVNQLVVSNGAAVYIGTNGIVGKNNGANANSIVVTDPGTSFWVGTNLYVGSNGSLNRLVISNSALVMHERYGGLGVNLNSVSNEAVVTGPGSAWRYGVILSVGGNGAGNRLTITNGGLVTGNYGVLGGSEGSNNLTIVTGPGSVWSNRLDFALGSFGGGNRLIVSEGGRVDDDNGCIGQNSTSIDNEALVTGPGSSWINLNLMQAGRQGSRSRLTVTNGGLVSANQIVVGDFALSTNNRVLVDGGALRATNVAGDGILDVRRGTNVLNAGLTAVDRLLLTNSQGFFEFNGGTLAVNNSTFGNGQVFRVGNGVSPATLLLAGNGTHAFSSSGLSVAANGVLAGNGTASGAITVQPGGLLSPGASIGRIFAMRIIPPLLQGTVLMEVSKTGSVLTNDVLQVPAAINYGGSLIVSNLGPTALVAADSFRLFVAGGYAGAFTTITLPPLNPGLGWTNKLLVDGSIEVIATGQVTFTHFSLVGDSFLLSGTGGSPNAPYNILSTTNIAEPPSNWVNHGTLNFDSGGQFSFSYGIEPGEPQRFFRIRLP